jgi:hypothetical protein
MFMSKKEIIWFVSHGRLVIREHMYHNDGYVLPHGRFVRREHMHHNDGYVLLMVG